jgi:hypothetical protein
MTMRSWLRSLFTRHYPSPARRPRDAAPDVRRVPAWDAACVADGGRPGTPPDAVSRASRNPSFETIQFHRCNAIVPSGSPDRRAGGQPES